MLKQEVRYPFIMNFSDYFIGKSGEFLKFLDKGDKVE